MPLDRLAASLRDRADESPFTPSGERRRRRLHRLASLMSRHPSG